MIAYAFLHKFHTPAQILFGILLLVTHCLAQSEQSEQSQLAQIALLSGQPVVHVTKQQQMTSGLITRILQSTKYQSELIAYGEVIDLQPLLDLRSRYFKAITTHKIARVKLNLARQSLTRVRNLHRNGAISKRKLQIQQSQWEEAQAHHDAILYEINLIKDSTLLNWGNPLCQWAFATDSKEFSSLISDQQTLLQIILPPNQTLPMATESIFVAREGLRSKAVKAHILSPAQETNEEFQGEAFYFITSTDIQTGMHVTAWIAREQNNQSGVVLPASALVRHLGQTYVYLQTGDTEFIRHVVATQLQTGDGYFVQAGILPGDKLVTTGAQMLLSEEFRGQIPDEDDD